MTSTEKFAVAVGSLAFAALAFLACLDATVAPRYADFIVGSITWRAASKLQDLLAAPVVIATVAVTMLLLALGMARQKQRFGPDHSMRFAEQLVWWSLPSIALVTGLIVGGRVDGPTFVLSAAGIVFVAVACAYHAWRGTPSDPQVIGLGALALLLIALIPMELALVIGRFPGDAVPLASYERATKAFAVIGMAAGLVYAMRLPESFRRFLPVLLLVAQLGLVLLYFSLFPATLVQPDGTITRYPTTWALKLLVAGLVIAGAVDVVRRHVKYAPVGDGVWGRLISPLALLALLVALRHGATFAPAIDPDDYHFGENLLGWWSYLRGTVPYAGYFPAHGIVDDDLRGFVSFLFYDGSAGSIAEAGRVTFTLLALPAILAVYRLTGSIGLAFVSIWFVDNAVSYGAGFKWVFLIPFVCLWLGPWLVAQPARWLAVWILTAPIAILGVPAQGILLVAASGIVAAWMAWRLWKARSPRAWKEVGIALAILGVLALVTPFASMLFGAFRYALENGPINQVAYGVEWPLSWVAMPKTGFVFEVVRTSWVALPLVCLALVFRWARHPRAGGDVPYVAIVMLVFSLLTIPYAMGRIDEGGLSRPGIFSIFAWSVLLPLVLWSTLPAPGRILLVAAMAAVGSTMSIKALHPLASLSAAASSRTGTGPLKVGRNEGIPAIGIAAVQEEHWNGLVKLKSLLDEKLVPGETYLDLTGRQAQYFYLDRTPGTAVTGPYMMVAPAQQKRAVEELRRNLPRIALLKSSTFNLELDGGGLALRNPYLYRFILDSYTPRAERGFIVGYKRTGAAEEAAPWIEAEVRDFTDANWNRGLRRGQPGVIVDDPAVVQVLQVGDTVRIGQRESRRIERISTDASAIWFAGAPLEPAAMSYPLKVQVAVAPEVLADYRATLFQKAVARTELQKIPVAWGRSKQSLESKMRFVKGFDGLSPALVRLVAEGKVYKVSAADPYLTFDVSSLELSGRDAGLLKFDFSCVGRSADPRIQLYWWGKRPGGPTESQSIWFTAEDGTLIVPLDADPRWLATERITGIRIDLHNHSACQAIGVSGLGLHQRQDIPPTAARAPAAP